MLANLNNHFYFLAWSYNVIYALSSTVFQTGKICACVKIIKASPLIQSIYWHMTVGLLIIHIQLSEEELKPYLNRARESSYSETISGQYADDKMLLAKTPIQKLLSDPKTPMTVALHFIFFVVFRPHTIRWHLGGYPEKIPSYKI